MTELRRTGLVLVLVSTAACQCGGSPPTGDGGDVGRDAGSGGGNSGSGGGSAGGGGAGTCQVAPGTTSPPLTELCAVMQRGAINQRKTALTQCGAPIEDRDLPFLVNQRDFSCTEDGGFLGAALGRLAAKVDAGLMAYDAVKAAQCQALGRSMGSSGTQCEQNPCLEVFTGRVNAGGACEDSEDCVGELFCQPSRESSCLGRCVARLPPGAACDPDRDLCERGSPCLSVDGGFQCLVRAPVGGVCSQTRDCVAGLSCVNRRCVTRGDAGAPCVDLANHDDCLRGLGCVMQGGLQTCQPRAELGGACDSQGDGGPPCLEGKCLKCVAGRCVTGTQSSVCLTPSDCQDSFFCGDAGVCLFRARRGEPCQLTSGSDSRGSCLYEADFCRIPAGQTAGTCTPRPDVGAPCGPGPGLTTQCLGDAYCRFTTPDAGACAPYPRPSEACGNGPGRSTKCTPGACNLDAGVCVAPQPAGTPCDPRTGNCEAGLSCRRAPTPSVCTAKKASGQTCTENDECVDGLCDRVTKRCSVACSTTFDKEGASCSVGCPNGLRDGWILIFFSMVLSPLGRRRSR